MNMPVLKVDEILKKIDRELNLSSNKDKYSTAITDFDYIDLTRFSSNNYFKVKENNTYNLSDFLDYHDEDFIINAYKGILRRVPDQQGFKYYLDQLRNGTFSKIEILGRLSFSKEAKRYKVKIKGLTSPFFVNQIYKVPFLGYVAKMLVSIAKLPKILKNLQQYEAFANSRYSILNKEMDTVLQQLENHLNKLIVMVRGKVDITELNEEIQSLYNKINDMVTKEDHIHLEAELNRLNKTISRMTVSLNDEEEDIINKMYVAFEDKYRGTRDDIKQRVSVYLDIITKAGAGTHEAPILDLGCGRGEWLELLKEKGMIASGVDTNQAMVSQCQGIGLQALKDDALEYLQSLPSSSLGAVTGFHIIEHLPFNMLVKLLKEINRVLKLGGVIIFETPNPENIVVGSYSFYFDPSHINPLVPHTVQFIAEHLGFTNTEIIRLHKRQEPEYMGQKFVDEIIYKANMEQDYSIVGYKS